MFNRIKEAFTPTEAEEAVLAEACCVVNDAMEQVTEECCVALSDEAILAKDHPQAEDYWPGDDKWRQMSSKDQDALVNRFEADLKAWHDAYERVHGASCPHCGFCGGQATVADYGRRANRRRRD